MYWTGQCIDFVNASLVLSIPIVVIKFVIIYILLQDLYPGLNYHNPCVVMIMGLFVRVGDVLMASNSMIRV